jgi:hypothetical protein
MQRVNRSTAVVALPAAPAGGTPGYFTGGNPGAGQAATTPGYEWFNAVQEELMAVILRGGLSASASDLTQVRKSLDRLFGGAYSFFSTPTVTLTPDHTGLVWIDSSINVITLNLPANNSLNSRPMRYRIVRVGANPVIIQAQGANLINFQSSITLATNGDCVDIMGSGDGAWIAIGSISATTTQNGVSRFATAAETDAGTLSNVAVTPAGLGIATRNYANPGYARLPGGLIMQWGETNAVDIATSSSTVSAIFPIAFPNALLNLQATEKTSSAGYFSIVNAVGTLTGVTVTLNEWAAIAQNASVAYLAIGR